MFQVNGKYTNAKIMIDSIEPECLSQINTFLNHPAFTNPISIMPDTHAGKGSVIGFTMPMTEKIIPNVIGVDIGCGMLSINIGKLNMSLEDLDRKIRQEVPFGFETHARGIIHMKNDFPWHNVNVLAHKFALAYGERFNKTINPPQYDMNWFESKCQDMDADLGRCIASIGSLGGGNHFIEVGVSDNGEYWITIHTGSRNLGKQICEYWQNSISRESRKTKQEDLAKQIAFIRANYKGMEIKNQIRLAREKIGLDENVSDALQYLEGDNASGYLFDMIFAQQYAKTNRAVIASLILGNVLDLDVSDLETIECVHNFIDFKDFIIRKGSIRSYVGEKMVIPFNMRDGILICEGKSNADWNFSAPHGAGRVMSRAKAKKEININTFKNQMSGIYSTSVSEGTLDEAPDAYKDAKIIEEAIEPTAKILFRIKPVMNMKDQGKKGRSDD
jgi:RNA-splicing ligase RtcB